MSITWGRARRVAAEAAWVLPAVEVSLAEGLGLVLAAPVLARTPVPAFDIATVDGWAVCGPGPWREEDNTERVVDGAAVPVTAGQALLPGTDSVLARTSGVPRPETSGVWVYVGDPRFDLLAQRPGHLEPGTAVEFRGTVADVGSTRARAGIVVTPAVLAAAAEAGHDALAVVRPADVAIVLVGDERWDHGPSRDRRTRDAVTPAVLAAVVRAGGRCLPLFALPGGTAHQRQPLAEIIEDAAADLIIVTGPAGGAARMETAAALQAIGAAVLLDDVAMTPGGDTLLARTTDGRLVAFVPGDPQGAISALATVVVPALTVFTGRPFPARATALLDRGLAGHPEATRLVGGIVTAGELTTTVEPVAGTGIRTLSEADALIVVPPGGAAGGDLVELVSLP